jgi:hypothetical protein
MYVELGPGRGTLVADLLKGTAALTPFAKALQVGLCDVYSYVYVCGFVWQVCISCCFQWPRCPNSE